MNSGGCVFFKCKMPSGTCFSADGRLLLLCQQHYEHVTNLQTKELVEKVFSIKKEEGSNDL